MGQPKIDIHTSEPERLARLVRPISQWDDVPVFQDESAEAEFWDTNRPSLKLMESSVMQTKSASSESVTISLRIDAKMLARLKRLARARFLNYQSMMKQWIAERMEEEVSNSD